MENTDAATVDGFGREWRALDQSRLSQEEAEKRFNEYFGMFQFDSSHEGFDLGCGSGRWAKMIAPRVRLLHCIDPSDAIHVAARNIRLPNVDFIKTSADNFALTDQDFGCCIGVLHHIPDPEAALRRAVEAIKPGGQFLVYIYYALENRPRWYRALWKATDFARIVISRLPFPLKRLITFLIAALVYWPLARLARSPNWPLAVYHTFSFYTMRTDALDRFGTRLEKRFTQTEIREMMERAGLENIRFSSPPSWVAIGTRRLPQPQS